MARRRTEEERRRRGTAPKDTARLNARSVLFGGGVFDTSGEHPNKKGWDIYELGQKSFWAVHTVVAWDEPVREDPEYAEPIAAMLAFLCPGEKTAVTGASYISQLVRSEEAKFYFVSRRSRRPSTTTPSAASSPRSPAARWSRRASGCASSIPSASSTRTTSPS